MNKRPVIFDVPRGLKRQLVGASGRRNISPWQWWVLQPLMQLFFYSLARKVGQNKRCEGESAS